MRTVELIKEDVNKGFRISSRETKLLVETQQKEIEQMKQYIKNGIRWGYIDDREMEYKKFIE